MFDRDCRHYRSTPRSLNDAFGPYARLSVHQKRKPRIAPVLWILAYGFAIGALWYAAILVRVS
jgi:hypothetical protein